MSSNCEFVNRGETFYGNRSIDSNNLGGVEYEGASRIFQDLDYSLRQPSPRTERMVQCLFVRNAATVAMLPKMLATWQGTKRYQRVDGFARLTGQEVAGVVDEWLPAAGAPVGDLFWLAIKGPSQTLTPMDALSPAIVVGDVLVALTVAASTGTTAGRITVQDLTGATALLGAQIQNAFGKALTAKTTTQTNASVLVELGKW